MMLLDFVKFIWLVNFSVSGVIVFFILFLSVIGVLSNIHNQKQQVKAIEDVMPEITNKIKEQEELREQLNKNKDQEDDK